MRRWPLTHDDPGRFGYQTRQTLPRPQDIGETKRQFMRAGGLTFFPTAAAVEPAPAFDARPSGVQLLAYMDVPTGETAFVRQVHVAPYCPPQLADPFRGWDEHWQDFVPTTWPRPVQAAFDPQAGATRATAQASVYTTPLGWLSYLNTNPDDLRPISWEWLLVSAPGDFASLRKGYPSQISLADPRSWYLQPDIPVPTDAYPTGIPGTLVSNLGAQRMQVLPEYNLDLNLVVGGGACLLLFARWRQQEVQIRGRDIEGSTVVEDGVYPLLPSFGRFQGWLQPSATPPTLDNAVTGL